MAGWVKLITPRAALLATLAGIAIIFFQGFLLSHLRLPSGGFRAVGFYSASIYRPRAHAGGYSSFTLESKSHMTIENTTYYAYSKHKPFLMRLFSPQADVCSPYCESCRKWVKMYKPMLGMPVTANILSELQESNIVKSLRNQDWSVLNSYEGLRNWRITQPSIRISLGHCTGCDGPFCVLGEVRGRGAKAIIMARVFSIEIDKKSALELLETALSRNLTANKAMYKKAVEFCKELGGSKDFAKLEKARSLSLRASLELNRGILNNAEAHFNEALQIFEELGEKKSQAMVSRGLASLYHRRKDLDKTETFINRSLAVFKELDDKPEMAVAYGSLSQIQFERKAFDSAELLTRKALEIETTLGHKAGMATAYHALGAVYKAQEKLEQAKDAYETAQKIYGELGNKPLKQAMQTELEQL